jgi:hypothetical protein
MTNPAATKVFQAVKVLGDEYGTSYRCSNSRWHSWKGDERIKIISALLLILQTFPKATESLKRLHDECSNLLKMCSRTTFREADFISSVRDLCGEDGVNYCRALLDGIGDGSTENYGHFLKEGRCIICNTSTYEEDDDVGKSNDVSSSENAVILCDGCNAEVHLRCLDLVAVPNDAWFCSHCLERNAKRENKSTIVLESIDLWRDKEEEERLLNEYIDYKIPELRKKGKKYSNTHV